MRNLFFAVLLFSAASSFAVDPPKCSGSGCPVPWSYCDINRWPQNLCRSGSVQSPLNIPARASIGGPELLFRYSAFRPTIKNTSYSIMIINPAGTLVIGSETYNVKEFHFHVPGEHTFAGIPADMELHIVHETSTAPVKTAVVSVLFDSGAVNNELLKITNALPAECCVREVGPGFELRNLLPLNPQNLLYFRYAGSLTTPPCSETRLTHYVLQRRQSASAAQIGDLRQMIGPNAREARNSGARNVVLVRPSKK